MPSKYEPNITHPLNRKLVGYWTKESGWRNVLKPTASLDRVLSPSEVADLYGASQDDPTLKWMQGDKPFVEPIIVERNTCH